jgi:hypothetical protein
VYTSFLFLFSKEPNIHSFILTATKILEGEEVFINYGPNFFPTSPNAEEEVEEPKPTSPSSIKYAGDSDSGSSYFED